MNITVSETVVVWSLLLFAALFSIYVARNKLNICVHATSKVRVRSCYFPGKPDTGTHMVEQKRDYNVNLRDRVIVLF
jgi:hypothetical protein